MKIAHICLCGPFTEGMTYQENLLSLQNALDGHDVLIIASRYSWEKDRIVKLPECSKMLVGGIKLVRISYDNILNDYITRLSLLYEKFLDLDLELRRQIAVIGRDKK